MTNLTSEQYREILHNVEGTTAKTPNMLHLLRSAVETFYCSFGCYPEIASASPGSVTIFGEQTQFDEGITFTIPTPMATVIVGRKVPGHRVGIATSADVGKPHKLSFGLSDFPMAAGKPVWLNYLKGVIAIYCCKSTITAFQAAIESSIPLGVGLGSASALEVAMLTFLELMFGEISTPLEKALACCQAEENFTSRTLIGPIPRLCSAMAKDRHAIIFDAMTLEAVDFVPFRHREVSLVVIDPHLKDELCGYEYSETSKCFTKACNIMGIESMRYATKEMVDALEEKVAIDIKLYEGFKSAEKKVPQNEMLLLNVDWPMEKLTMMVNRARFYVTEMKRIEEAREAWKAGDVVTFGQKMTESHASLKNDCEFDNPVLEFLTETSLSLPGVLGAKMIGLGLLNGGAVAVLIYKANLQQFHQALSQTYDENKDRLFASMYEESPKHSSHENSRRKKFNKHDRKNDINQKHDEMEKDDKRKSEEETEMEVEEKSEECLHKPTLYIINPIAGARMLFPVMTDLLRSRFARRTPQPKELIRNAIDILQATHQREPEAIALAPATTTLFGEFLEYSMGYILSMALPLLTVTLGCRNNQVSFRMKTTSKEVGNRTEFQAPVPCAGSLELQNETWINYAASTVAEFKGNVPGFVCVVESSIPCKIGLNSCAAFQSSIYLFLENLTATCTEDPLEKAERCHRVEKKLVEERTSFPFKCSTLKFNPTFLCKQGYVLFTNCKNLKMANYYLYHPSYAFLFAYSRNISSNLTLQAIIDRLRSCQEAAEILGVDTLVNADERHIRCLQKKGVCPEMIKRTQYIVSEQQRCARAVEAIKNDDYETLGLLMTRSHISLRDQFQVSNSQIDLIVDLALAVDGVLGAKLVGKGLTTTVLILAKISSIDACIRNVRKNYVPKYDKPSFYVFRPSSGAYQMDVDQVQLIP